MMLKLAKMVVLFGLSAALLASPALAEEGDGDGPRRRPPREARDRLKQLADLRGLASPLLLTEKGQQEMRRFHEELKTIGEAVKALREAVKKDVDSGEPRRVVRKHFEKANALAKQLVAANVKHFENLAAIGKDVDDGAIRRLSIRLMHGPRRGPRHDGERPPRRERDPKRDEPEKGDDQNPFDD